MTLKIIEEVMTPLPGSVPLAQSRSAKRVRPSEPRLSNTVRTAFVPDLLRNRAALDFGHFGVLTVYEQHSSYP